MLYAIHSLRFYAHLAQTRLRKTLPHLPHHFVSRQMEPDHWRRIVLQMERAAHDPAKIEAIAQSAARTLSLFHDYLLDCEIPRAAH